MSELSKDDENVVLEKENKVRKISISLSESVVADLDFLSECLGVTRSAFLSSYLSDSLGEVVATARELAVNIQDSDRTRRMKGKSRADIDNAVSRILRGGTRDMFN